MRYFILITIIGVFILPAASAQNSIIFTPYTEAGIQLNYTDEGAYGYPITYGISGDFSILFQNAFSAGLSLSLSSVETTGAYIQGIQLRGYSLTQYRLFAWLPIFGNTQGFSFGPRITAAAGIGKYRSTEHYFFLPSMSLSLDMLYRTENRIGIRIKTPLEWFFDRASTVKMRFAITVGFSYTLLGAEYEE
ncbi:MAG: hypothetical protein ACLFR1_13930 [Spirochaetia bacterium]